MDKQNAVTPEALRREERKKKILKELREWIVSLAVALLAVVVLRNYVFTLIRVDGESMQDTLLDGERLFVTVADVKFGDVNRGDIVICHYPDRGGTFFVKRVVALPGDSIYRESSVTHVVYSDGDAIIDEALDPDYSIRPLRNGPDYGPYVLGEDEYFVVGDNRYDSHDSRDWNDSDASNDVGPITKDMITGRVRSVIWPPKNIRTVE
ncbi:MAG: signal peptidase I [Clostridia bacterium]|nr:signal peptidase I [Clostridia bacterium]